MLRPYGKKISKMRAVVMRKVMPTPPLEPVPPPKNETEEQARKSAVEFIQFLMAALNRYTYNHRSHLPCGFDATDFMDNLENVFKFCKERPDWSLVVVKSALKVCSFPLMEWIAEESPEFAKKLAEPV